MNNNDTQKIWQELEEKLLCGRCKAGKLLLWEKPAFGDVPYTSKSTDNKHCYAVTCEYFKKPIQNSMELKRCSAFQAKK